MSNVSEVSSSLLASVNGDKSAKKATSEIGDVQDRFMTLLVTQMKNQDPLNPLDNAQVTSQLAQLSTVTGLDKVNATLESLKGTYQATQAMQATSMIGHGVLVPGSNVQLSEGKGVFGIELTEPADDVKVAIQDATGKTVQTLSLGSQETGTVPAMWDGTLADGSKAKDGSYTFKVEAKTGGQKTSATGLSFGQVNSVSTGSQGVKINVTGVGQMTLSDVRQIL
ncbi:MAG: flagellar hook assembly protein FlgD [Burkholderiales bacterium]|nr:flagellar hook assembly protein FlgD [Burkholderiales bacterium]